MQPTGGKFMQIGMPTGYQRDAAGMSEIGGQHADVAGSGKVNHIRLKGFQGLLNDKVIAPK